MNMLKDWDQTGSIFRQHGQTGYTDVIVGEGMPPAEFRYEVVQILTNGCGKIAAQTPDGKPIGVIDLDWAVDAWMDSRAETEEEGDLPVHGEEAEEIIIAEWIQTLIALVR